MTPGDAEFVRKAVGRLFRDIADGDQIRALDGCAGRAVRTRDPARSHDPDSVCVSCHAVALPPLANHEGLLVGRVRAMASRRKSWARRSPTRRISRARAPCST